MTPLRRSIAILMPQDAPRRPAETGRNVLVDACEHPIDIAPFVLRHNEGVAVAGGIRGAAPNPHHFRSHIFIEKMHNIHWEGFRQVYRRKFREDGEVGYTYEGGKLGLCQENDKERNITRVPASFRRRSF